MRDLISCRSFGDRHFDVMNILKGISGVFVVVCIILLAFHLAVSREEERTMALSGAVSFSVMRGDTTLDVARHLMEAHLVSSQLVFLGYLFETKQWGKFVAGQYTFSGKLAFDDIARKLIDGDVVPKSVRVTFPEGFTMKQIAARLSEHDLPGAEFLALAEKPTPELLRTSDLLSGLPAGANLEGFLFPDTYEFAFHASAMDIAQIFLRNFDTRFDDTLRAEMKRQQKNIYEVVIMASLLEAEVRSESDRKLVSDLFARRNFAGMPLQSDATVRYALGIDKSQYSGVDIATKSPYNTYVNKGLPVGPIDNPGSIALRAALFPAANDFWYFLSDQKTGETIFSRDFEEHKKNKLLHGL